MQFATSISANIKGVYMIFKYGKRFRFAPSFNNGLTCLVIRNSTRARADLAKV